MFQIIPNNNPNLYLISISLVRKAGEQTALLEMYPIVSFQVNGDEFSTDSVEPNLMGSPLIMNYFTVDLNTGFSWSQNGEMSLNWLNTFEQSISEDNLNDPEDNLYLNINDERSDYDKLLFLKDSFISRIDVFFDGLRS